MIDTPITELHSDHGNEAPWSEAALRATFKRRTRAKAKQLSLDHPGWDYSRLMLEAERAARVELERAVNVENEARRRDGRETIALAVA